MKVPFYVTQCLCIEITFRLILLRIAEKAPSVRIEDRRCGLKQGKTFQKTAELQESKCVLILHEKIEFPEIASYVYAQGMSAIAWVQPRLNSVSARSVFLRILGSASHSYVGGLAKAQPQPGLHVRDALER